jgi:beta-N-acetylhexosaminidase
MNHGKQLQAKAGTVVFSKKLSMKNLFSRIILFVSFILLSINCGSKKNSDSKAQLKKESIKTEIKALKPVFADTEYASEGQKKWVDSIYNQFSFEEKLGQLFMVAAFSNKDTIHTNAIDKLIFEKKIGGLIFMQGGPFRQARLTNRYQSESKVPLFIGIDAEWGLAMRLDSVNRFPFNMTLGAIQDLNLIEKVGQQMAKQTKRIGAHFNFSPVIDINTNPKNPIIGVRSFGEDKFQVTERASRLVKGMQSEGIFATGKHFPGHGDTDKDSHLTLPTLSLSKDRIDDIELYPYKKLFSEDLASVMVAHLNVPSLETRLNYPSSISYNVVTNVLQKQLKFKGLIFTDALNMKGASNFKEPGAIDLEAFLAGNDVLLFAEDVPVAIQKLTKAYNDTLFSDERLALSVKKILKYKYKIGLNNFKPIQKANIVADINSIENQALQYELYENAITVIQNKNEILPIKNLEKEKIAYVKFGNDSGSTFLTTLQKYTDVTEISDKNIDILLEKLKPFTTVICALHRTDKNWRVQEFEPSELAILEKISKSNNIILDVFAKPYALMPILNLKDYKAIVVSYQNTDVAQVVSAELLFGAIESKGKLPVSINTDFNNGFGLTTKKINRLGFTSPENVGMKTEILNKIESVAQKAIDGKMTPGMQVLVARKGKVVYQKSFGFQTYENLIKVKNTDLYDAASVTKIISTLPNVMKLYDDKKINLESNLGYMIPSFANTDKNTIIFKQLLSHYAGFQAWIPFYKSTLEANKIPDIKYYRKNFETGFTKKVADSLFIRDDYNDTIMKIIGNSKLSSKIEYKYSDFTFFILKDFLERTTKKTLNVLSQENFYGTIGMNNTLYNPLTKFDKSVIAPTENDNYFRYQTIQGYVHDMGAAMQGGVGGHAGIFSNAMDVAKMMQMYLQKGNYGGIEYFSKKTFDDFNTCYYYNEGNRRGLGFDKPQISGDGPTCNCVSKSSFGHTGFTGIMTWADPETELVYVFMSNRTFPDSNAPNLLSKNNIREEIQKIIQDAIVK